MPKTCLSFILEFLILAMCVIVRAKVILANQKKKFLYQRIEYEEEKRLPFLVRWFLFLSE